MMLADVIEKLAHEVAEGWAERSFQFSAADQMGRSLARANPEFAVGLLKAASVEKEGLGLLGKGLALGAGVGTIYGGKKAVGALKKRHEQLQTSPYIHGQTGGATFRQSFQM